ncbi:T9SS type A sorting domain-containing protein [Mariniflexile sp. AS56]|uniref:T9SS type A sorting domain-containing protein n=1 Tax=Mariniflexile sp. AS56 TaxID=3063957 RepID=UPI0026EA10CD|nr:T9SS type A sorting domain-containing protein [Mariniflexile sp. AS56]MDO7172380.1 T9SS type A sorting domain-containing protein [Mariniflexile sp. AS56]
MKKLLLLKILFLFCLSVNAQSDIITIDPTLPNQSVVFGGDNKLTIKAWAEGNTNSVSAKLFQDMNLQILRVPIFALQPITDNIYDNVITVINSVKSYNPDVKIFASVANGDGYGINYHNAEKFPASWTGCCAYNVYSLNLTTYSAYLDSFMQRMTDAGITVDYLAPYNEDPGDDSDYLKIINQMTKLGSTEMVGVESYALSAAVNSVDDIEDRVAIVGSHFYDDGSIAESDWDSTWASLVAKSEDPVWYTEATRYSTGDGIGLLIAGIDNIFAPIRGGAEGVIFYQVCKRFVYANGSALPVKYSGFKNIVNNAEGQVISSTSNNSNIKLVVFGNESTLDVHIINKNTTENTVDLQLLNNYMGDGIVNRKLWTSTDTGTASTYPITNASNWNIVVPATSYSHLKITLNKSILSTSKVSFNNQEIKIIPNPSANGRFQIKIPNSNPSDKIIIKMYTVDGKEIYNDIRNFEPILLLNHPLVSGMYIISVSNGQQVYTNKVMVSQ